MFAERLIGGAAIVSSFGAESAALLHLIASIDASVPGLFLDTDKHFPETLVLGREAIAWGATAQTLSADTMTAARNKIATAY